MNSLQQRLKEMGAITSPSHYKDKNRNIIKSIAYQLFDYINQNLTAQQIPQKESIVAQEIVSDRISKGFFASNQGNTLDQAVNNYLEARDKDEKFGTKKQGDLEVLRKHIIVKAYSNAKQSRDYYSIDDVYRVCGEAYSITRKLGLSPEASNRIIAKQVLFDVEKQVKSAQTCGNMRLVMLTYELAKRITDSFSISGQEDMVLFAKSLVMRSINSVETQLGASSCTTYASHLYSEAEMIAKKFGVNADPLILKELDGVSKKISAKRKTHDCCYVS